jgi:hypothetical protein
MDICVNLKKSLKRSKQFYIISFPQVWKFFWPRPQAPQARPWQERDHGMRYGREALGAKVIACQYLPALSLRGQPKAWKQRKASAPRQQRLWNTFHSLYNIYVYIYIFIYKYIYIYIYIYLFISQPHGGLQLQIQLPLRLFNNCLVWTLPGSYLRFWKKHQQSPITKTTHKQHDLTKNNNKYQQIRYTHSHHSTHTLPQKPSRVLRVLRWFVEGRWRKRRLSSCCLHKWPWSQW